MTETHGGGCCPPMDLMRSEPLQLVQVIVPMESAHLTVSYLGYLGVVQFKDESIGRFIAWSSAIIVLVLVMILLDLMGMMVILGIQLNAVSVVNLIMSIGIAVEFCVHISHAFLMSSGNREQRAREALGTMGGSVFSEITLTKLAGVMMLCFARSEIFVVYYFQMYLALVIIGFLHGLVFLPVILSLVGPSQRHLEMEEQQQGRDEASSSLLN